MPVRPGKIKKTGADALLHTCENCGEDAYFGIGASYLKALNEIAKGDIQKAKELLGKWYCLECWRLIPK